MNLSELRVQYTILSRVKYSTSVSENGLTKKREWVAFAGSAATRIAACCWAFTPLKLRPLPDEEGEKKGVALAGLAEGCGEETAGHESNRSSYGMGTGMGLGSGSDSSGSVGAGDATARKRPRTCFTTAPGANHSCSLQLHVSKRTINPY